MKAFTQLQNSLDQKAEALNQYLQSLSVRERVMVVFSCRVVLFCNSFYNCFFNRCDCWFRFVENACFGKPATKAFK